MAPDQPYDPNSRQVTSSGGPRTESRPAHSASVTGSALADRLVTYLERLAIADGRVRQVQAAYTDRLPDTASARRHEPTPDRSADPDRGRDW